MRLQLDRAGRDLGIVRLLIPMLHHAFHGDTVFLIDPFQQGSIPQYDLKHSVHVPEVDKRYPSVVADIFHPSRGPQRLSDILLADMVNGHVPINI